MPETKYDYVVVGAGSAGCALVERLTRDGRKRVLLVEAGGSDRQIWIKVPIGYAINFRNSKLNWNYHAEPDPYLNGRRVYWPRGRVIGGSSSINAMTYMRGLPRDFEDWECAGAHGWGWHDVRPAFEKMEQHLELDDRGAQQALGDGLLTVSDLKDRMAPFSSRFLTAAHQCGWAFSENLGTAADEAVGYYRSTVRNGVRHSAADAFLTPARKRPNLDVMTETLVEKVVFEGTRATGIYLRRKGDVRTIQAGREVILCAGAVNSPKLLQLSGVGPAALLRDCGIDVVADRDGVGRGLQDHLAITHAFRANRPTLNAVFGRFPPRILAALHYFTRLRGPLSVPVNQVGGYVRSGKNLRAPDMQIYCNPITYQTSGEGAFEVDRMSGYMLSAQLCRPTSRGEIRIRSADPADVPLILPNSLSTEQDLLGAVRAVSLIAKIAAAPALAAVTQSRLSPTPDIRSRSALLEDFRERASTVFHPTSTCRMGSEADGAVLDARLCAHGLTGLRVVDASAFPTVTSGNTNAPTMMLATRAAEMILQDAADGRLERVLAHAS